MPSEKDELREQLKERRRLREEQRQREARERRKLYIRLGAVGVVLVLVAVLIFVVSQNPGEPLPEQTGSTQQPQETTTAPEETTVPKEPQQPETTTIHIAAAGDLNITDQVLELNSTLAGYDLTNALLDVAPVLTGADLTVLNLEGTFAGLPYGGERSSAPQEVAKLLSSMGVDAVQTANSASIRAGILGLQSTIQTLRNEGIAPLGTFEDSAAYRKSGGYTILEVQGLRIALVGFTKGMDNLGLPEGSENCVNLLYTDYTTDYKKVDTDGINRVLRQVREEQPDLTIAMLHWGSEYNEDVSSSQEKIAQTMLDGGVDIILGSHSHLLNAIDHNTEKNTLVAWSLGDLYGEASTAGTNYSVILDIQVTRDNLTGVTTIDGFECIPIYTLKPDQSALGGQRVVRIREAMERYDAGYLGKVTEEAYSAMEYSLTRIGQRIAGE